MVVDCTDWEASQVKDDGRGLNLELIGVASRLASIELFPNTGGKRERKRRPPEAI